jgi:hypothetical protein
MKRAVLATQHLQKALGDKNVCRWIATHTVSTNRNTTRRRRFLPPLDIAANGGCAGARFPLSTNSLRIGPTSVERENTIVKPVRNIFDRTYSSPAPSCFTGGAAAAETERKIAPPRRDPLL